MKISYHAFSVSCNTDLFYVVNLGDIAPDYSNEISLSIVHGQGSCMTWVQVLASRILVVRLEADTIFQ